MTILGSELRELMEVDEGEDDQGLEVLATAEIAECTCPEFCERDHDLD